VRDALRKGEDRRLTIIPSHFVTALRDPTDTLVPSPFTFLPDELLARILSLKVLQFEDVCASCMVNRRWRRLALPCLRQRLVPSIKMEDLVCPQALKDELVTQWELVATLSNYHIPSKHAMGPLLYGFQNCGKKTLVRAFAHHTDRAYISTSHIMFETKHIENKIRNVFRKARYFKPSVLCFDDVAHFTSTLTLTELLIYELKRCAPEEVYVIGCTYRPDMVHPKLLDMISSPLYLPLPTREERFELLRRFFIHVQVEESIASLGVLADRFAGFTVKDLIDYCRRAILKAAASHKQENPGTIFVSKKDLELIHARPRGESDARKYELFARVFERPALSVADSTVGYVDTDEDLYAS